MKRALLFANTEWYLYNFRLSLARALQAAGYEVILISPPGPYGHKLRELGFDWRPAPMARLSLNPFSELRLLWWLIQLLRHEQIDVVHGFTIKCAVYGSLAARVAGNRPRIGAVAGLGYVFTSRSIKALVLRPMVRLALRLALGGKRARLILQNPDDMALFESARLARPDQLRLIPGSGVDVTRFKPAEGGAKRTVDDAFRIVLPARLLWDKGIAEWVAAAEKLKSTHPQITLLLAGEPDAGNPAAVPAEKFKAWHNAGIIEWLGKVDDMPALFQSVDAVALPSYREGLPKSLIEAAGCGLPLITTDVPGCREVVTHEQDGLLIPPRNADALAAAIARLADDPELCQQLGAAARQRALAEFDEQIVIEKTLGVYGDLQDAQSCQTH
ncbi:glycosyltransferase [Spiribacter sp. C176]|uniref:Glycosyltransferase n=1 Tax=Spiribacter salilacus TaxID=2664894 RepID=A0A6N7QV81_9GAMM|nr:glycosyltransferase family 4 protein [Spiribacter salilacus]MRH79058.1 glycosyltransferase [Spiribacter salilacus]